MRRYPARMGKYVHDLLAIAAGLLIGAGVIIILTRADDADTDGPTSLAWLLLGLGIGAAVAAVVTRRRRTQ